MPTTPPQVGDFFCGPDGKPAYQLMPAARTAKNLTFPSGWQSGSSYKITRTASGNSPETVTMTGSTACPNIQVGWLLTGVKIYKGAGIGWQPRNNNNPGEWIVGPGPQGIDIISAGTKVGEWELQKLSVQSVPKGTDIPFGSWTKKIFIARSNGQGGITWDPPN